MNSKVKTVLGYSKAIVSAVAAGVVAYVAAKNNDGTVTTDEWWGIVGAVGAGGGITWLVPNAGAKKKA